MLSSGAVEEVADFEEMTTSKIYDDEGKKTAVMTQEMLADKKSKDAATSHLRQQAFQRALIRNGANFDILQNPAAYGNKGRDPNKYKIQQKSLEVSKTSAIGS